VNEDQLIDLVIDADHKARYRLLLQNPKKRRKILDRLNHSPALNPARTRWFSSFAKALRQLDVAPDTPVYLLSDISHLDGKTVPFCEAIEQVPRGEWGTLLGISEHLALYYGECGERAAIISTDEATKSG
jgi:hypothetical protein